MKYKIDMKEKLVNSKGKMGRHQSEVSTGTGFHESYGYDRKSARAAAQSEIEMGLAEYYAEKESDSLGKRAKESDSFYISNHLCKVYH